MGMTEIEARARRLASVSPAVAPAEAEPEPAAAADGSPDRGTMRRSGDVWAIGLGDRSVNMPDSQGLRLIAALLARPLESFQARFKKYGRPPQAKIGVGDSVVVSIWEAAGGGLFDVDVDDRGEPGTSDTFTIIGSYSNSGLLQGGNIQNHGYSCQ